MQRKLLVLLLISVLGPSLMFASGKIKGKVTDAGTGEPLVGANVFVLGTSMGAATNTSGEYTVLNVPAGTYALKTSYVGYQAITLNNIRVNNDLTTEANFQLPAEGVTVATVEIVAERPMINKNATNAVRIIDNEFFDKIPARGLDAAVVLQPGVYEVPGTTTIYIRGGRPDEVGFSVEGVGVSDPLYGGRGLSVIAEAVEQTQVQAGGYNAEYGGANAGIISSQLRTGSPDRWKASLLGETDRFTQVGNNKLGGYSYGYGDMTLTTGGPAPILGNKLRFFGSLENTYYRSQDPSVHSSPISFVGANAVTSDPLLTPVHPDSGISDKLNMVLPGYSQVGGGDNHWTMAGTALLDLSAVQLRVSGSYGYEALHEQNTYADILDASRLPLDITRDGLLNARLSHIVTPTLFYEANFSYYNHTYISEDPQLQGNLFAYGDPAANAALGYGLEYIKASNSWVNWPAYTFFGGNFGLNQPGTQIAGYDKRSEKSIGGRIDLTDQLPQNEVKVGGSYTRYTIRRYNPSDVFSFYTLSQEATSQTQLTQLLLKTNVGTDAYGYDAFGNEINGDVSLPDGGLIELGPRHPVEASAYIQDKIELSDLILNLGLRWDYINPDSKDISDPTALSYDGSDFILSNTVLQTAKTSQISPRLGFSFPATDRTVFHAAFGKFIQQTEFRDSYMGPGAIWGLAYAGRFITNGFGWGLKPTRTTQYEVGFSQQVSDFASFDVSAFYKDIMDQVTLNYYVPSTATGKPYYALVNGDFSTAEGVELRLNLRRVNRVSAQVNYTFSDTRSTGTNTQNAGGLWSAGSVVSLPKYINPVDFNSPHRGDVILDYRFAKGDGGPILQRLGLDLLLSFNSGHSYTRLEADQFGPAPGDPRFRTPIEPIGASTTPWYFQLDARLDKTFSVGVLDLNVYVYVINLLNTDNAVNVFFRTGDANNDGFLSTSTGQGLISQYGQQFVNYYNARFDGLNSGNFGPPRQIRFGLKLDY
ncbi:MAG TPA: carboxypeptidase-like regulatory domain-containing protein [Bacteroidota bacterium]|nr:carboxypeptidase-like regulatory domain-containing protein [Bacteroidota bacterium]